MSLRNKDTLLIIGDQSSDRVELRKIFESKFYILEAENAYEGSLLLTQNQEYIVAVLADIPLYELKNLADICSAEIKKAIPLIAITETTVTGSNEEYAFILGATDVVLKPYTTLSILRRVETLADLNMHQKNLERLVASQSETIRQNSQIMIDTLATIIEYRSNETGNHVLRIRNFTKVLLEEVQKNFPEYELTPEIIAIITNASSLHDIGKIAIPDHILNKPARLTDEEFEIMKTHTTIGSELIDNFKYINDETYLRYIYNVTLYHHERWDGSGYPKGLKGDGIPICAQVVGVADAYDSLTSKRAYKPAYSHEVAINMILNGECGEFSPKILDCLKTVQAEFAYLSKKFADGFSVKSEELSMELPSLAKTGGARNALQTTQRKYHALLHYMNQTVVELDLTNSIYHVVYNPNPDFASMFKNLSFEKLPERILDEMMHPDDVKQAGEQYGKGMAKLFLQGGQTYSFNCHMHSPIHNCYYPYEITLQKIVSEDPSVRQMIIIFNRIEGEGPKDYTAEAAQKPLYQSPALLEISNAVICCLNDDSLTICEGQSSLSPILGFSLENIWNGYNNSLANMIHPDDKAEVLRRMRKQDIRSGRKELQFRIACKQGGYAWVLCRSRADIDVDGVEYLYCTITDISEIKEAHESLEGKIQRAEILLNMYNNVMFEWDIKTDIAMFENWENRFGYKQETVSFSEAMQNAAHVHPDDRPMLLESLSTALSGPEAQYIDVRILNSEGKYLWSRIRAKVVRDKNGEPLKLIGIVYDIDSLKNDAISMQQQAQNDELTGLLNKGSVQREIKKYLSEKSDDSFGAMLILDVDNFKSVNDSLGHFYGDEVLKQMGQTLKSLFRSKDIVGRVGGDEFVIMLKDLPNKEVLDVRCNLLCDAFRSLFAKLTPNLPVSVSLGAALAPEHGKTYASLYKFADEALYVSKARGKNQYSIYSAGDSFAKIASRTKTTKIDSDYRTVLGDEAVFQFAFETLYESHDLERSVNELLAYVGIHFNVSRVYIFENNADNTACSNTFEWCNVGITPEIESLQNLSYETDLSNWDKVYEENGMLYCSDVSELPPEIRRVVEPQGIKSMLHSAIKDKGVFRGFVGFDECLENHLWTQEQVNVLKLISDVLSVFVTKLRNEK